MTEYHDDGTVILRIKEASLNESGEYRCDARNEFGAAWTEAPISVASEGELPQEGEAPDFVEPIRPVTVLKNFLTPSYFDHRRFTLTAYRLKPLNSIMCHSMEVTL